MSRSGRRERGISVDEVERGIRLLAVFHVSLITQRYKLDPDAKMR